MADAMKMRVGILGAANIAKKNARAIRKSESCVVVAVASRDPAKAVAWIKEWAPTGARAYCRLLLRVKHGRLAPSLFRRQALGARPEIPYGTLHRRRLSRSFERHGRFARHLCAGCRAARVSAKCEGSARVEGCRKQAGAALCGHHARVRARCRQRRGRARRDARLTSLGGKVRAARGGQDAWGSGGLRLVLREQMSP